MIATYLPVAVLLAFGLAFVIGGTVTPFFLSPRSRGSRARDPYESGEVPVGTAWIRFDIYYYIFALLFVAFDVEAVFLFPVLVVYRQIPGWLPFIEVGVFLGILSVIIVYAWKKGYFAWK